MTSDAIVKKTASCARTLPDPAASATAASGTSQTASPIASTRAVRPHEGGTRSASRQVGGAQLRAREPGPGDQADRSRAEHHERERDPEHEQREERQHREDDQDRVAERPAGDPEQRGGDDPDHRPREAVEDARRSR